MTTYHYLGRHKLRDGYSIDIVEEDDSWVVYFNSRIHVKKRSRVGPAYSKDFSHEEILHDVTPYILKGRWGDVTHCAHCGR